MQAAKLVCQTAVVQTKALSGENKTVAARASTVLQNVFLDGKPLVGRSKIDPHYLWTDMYGRAALLECDFVMCAPLHLPRAVANPAGWRGTDYMYS